MFVCVSLVKNFEVGVDRQGVMSICSPRAVYHGPQYQRSSFPLLLVDLYEFLSSHPTETVIVSIKEEIPPNHPRFSYLLYKAIKDDIDEFWFLEDRIPRLEEVRGKIILLSRFDGSGDDGFENGIGIHPYTWPDSRKEGFEWTCGDTAFRIQDW